ncbi:MAG TPA: iron-sulfur cluster assembly accessory protein [Thermoanaerobaculia bacterium]|nr:iron-sulfur cluster assembly accessory protein [Thermoanaerobaculia bacterium]
MHNDSIDLDQLLDGAATGEATDATRSRAPVVAEGEILGLRLTPKAVKMVKLTREEEGIDPSFGLRVAVRGGGCSGFEYALDFDNERRPNDEVLEYEGLQVYVDPISSRYLSGTTIDYALGVSGTGFKFDNPRATGTCGCGSSFAV